jgi:lysozyme
MSFMSWLEGLFDMPDNILVATPELPPKPQRSALDLASSLICSFEGFQSDPYTDSAGIWTIGYGSIYWNGEPVTEHTLPVTQTQAMAAMEAELAPIMSKINKFVHVSVTDYQLAALCSLTYNIGIYAFAWSTLLRKLNECNYAGARAQFMVWNKATVNGVLIEVRGLTARRIREADVFGGASV